MEKLPVKLLTELLTPDEMIAANKVKDTHEVRFCPIGISLPRESGVSLRIKYDDEEFSEFRYSPRAYFAVKVWETAKDSLLKRQEFAGALDVEWVPVAASFRSVRFVNGEPEKFIAAMMEEMKRIADSHTIKIRYGRFDEPAIPERPDYPRRYYIMPLDLMKQRLGYGMKNEWKPLQDSPAGDFSWSDIADVFVVLKPIQLAFIFGFEMNRSTPLDEEFISACGNFDLKKVKELVAKGANIHAAEYHGDTALDVMTFSYQDIENKNEDGDPQKTLESRSKFIEIVQYLLSLGYNINLTGHGGSTCLGNASFIRDLDIIKFLLDNGADPNIGSYIGEEGPWNLGESALEIVWGDYCTLDPGENYYDLELMLLKYGALPVCNGEKLSMEKAIEWLEAYTEIGAPSVFECAKGLFFYHLALLIQCGAGVNARDEKGRNLLQIALEDASRGGGDVRGFRNDLAEMALMLLCGLKLKLSAEEIEQAKATCREKGYTEALDAITSVTSAGKN